MGKRPTISACLAVYNGADLLPKALGSMRGQTLAYDELVVVDDGSSDNSAEIAESFGARVIRQPNQGIGAARKRLVEEAKCDWIAFCDHDDWWASEKLERQAPFTERDNVVLIYSPWYEVDESGHVTGPISHASPDSPRLRHLVPNQELSPSSTLIRRSSLLEIGNFRTDMRIGEDTLALFLLLSAGEIVQVPEPLSYMMRRTSSTSAMSKSLFEHERKLYEDYLLPRWEDLYRSLPPSEVTEARRLVESKLAYIKSNLGVWAAWEGDRKAALAIHREALNLNPKSKGNWYRYLRAILGLRTRPAGL